MSKYGKRIREDKSVLKEPRCPFCREMFVPPQEISTDLGYFSGGKCVCGAVYVYDPSGKNMGEAFMDALVYACDQDWDRALSLEPEKDYQEVFVAYNSTSHTVSPYHQNFGLLSRRSELIFIKVSNDCK